MSKNSENFGLSKKSQQILFVILFLVIFALWLFIKIAGKNIDSSSPDSAVKKQNTFFAKNDKEMAKRIHHSPKLMAKISKIEEILLDQEAQIVDLQDEVIFLNEKIAAVKNPDKTAKLITNFVIFDDLWQNGGAFLPALQKLKLLSLDYLFLQQKFVQLEDLLRSYSHKKEMAALVGQILAGSDSNLKEIAKSNLGWAHKMSVAASEIVKIKRIDDAPDASEILHNNLGKVRDLLLQGNFAAALKITDELAINSNDAKLKELQSKINVAAKIAAIKQQIFNHLEMLANTNSHP